MIAKNVLLGVLFAVASFMLGGCWGSSVCEPVDAGPTDAGSDSPADCNSHNPCITDVNCTPCSTLPPGVAPTNYNCTPDDVLPPFCAGLLGCARLARTTPPGEVNDCFPVAPALDAGAVSGVCLAGVCVPNPSAPDAGVCNTVTTCGLKCANCLTALALDPSSCRVAHCDPTEEKTDPGAPGGCYSVPAAPGASCSHIVGPITCPGTCSGPVNDAGVDTCQPLFPMCGS